MIDDEEDLSELAELSDVDVDIYSYLPPKFQRKINELPKELVGMTEDDLMLLFKPNRLDRLLRLSLWKEFQRAAMTSGQFRLNRVYAGYCSKDNFNDHVLENPHRVAWLMTTPAGYKMQLENLLDQAMQRLEKILSLPLYKANGDVDTGLVSVVAKTALALREASRGKAVQRNLNVNADMSKNSPENLDKMIRDLEQRVNGLPDVIEVKGE